MAKTSKKTAAAADPSEAAAAAAGDKSASVVTTDATNAAAGDVVVAKDAGQDPDEIVLVPMYAPKLHPRLRRRVLKPLNQYQVFLGGDQTQGGVLVAYVGTHPGAPVCLLDDEYGPEIEQIIVAGINAAHEQNVATGQKSRIVGRPASKEAITELLRSKDLV